MAAPECRLRRHNAKRRKRDAVRKRVIDDIIQRVQVEKQEGGSVPPGSLRQQLVAATNSAAALAAAEDGDGEGGDDGAAGREGGYDDEDDDGADEDTGACMEGGRQGGRLQRFWPWNSKPAV